MLKIVFIINCFGKFFCKISFFKVNIHLWANQRRRQTEVRGRMDSTGQPGPRVLLQKSIFYISKGIFVLSRYVYTLEITDFETLQWDSEQCKKDDVPKLAYTT